ncbi:recombinase family protein [Haloglomus litoreum]|uniref:recombinase family protein n=1 Tax=Haloglomus litoreum TaxID=3034026 RepID=UPI0023E890EA|nr:recombinase family protein [Haloglomus sp. DT116]
MSKVAGYVRVSTEQQREEQSHEQQREKLTTWANRNDHEIEVFEDIAISGQSDDRPAYEEMMDRLDEFDMVAVRELSRFGRSLKRVLQDIERLDEHGVEFNSITEDFSTDSAMGTAMLQMIGVFNEFWANLARERALENVQRRRENGEPVGRPKKLDEEQRAEVFDLRRAGVSYTSIARVMEADPETPDSISRETIRRYCNDEGVTPET